MNMEVCATTIDTYDGTRMMEQGEAYRLIIPDQKVTFGAFIVVVNVVVKCFRILPGTKGGCVPAGASTLKYVEIRE